MIQVRSKTGRTWSWELGTKKPVEILIDQINFIVATEEELEIIKKAFCTNPDSHPLDRRYTIPMTNHYSMAWYGDIAKTILVNI